MGVCLACHLEPRNQVLALRLLCIAIVCGRLTQDPKKRHLRAAICLYNTFQKNWAATSYLQLTNPLRTLFVVYSNPSPTALSVSSRWARSKVLKRALLRGWPWAVLWPVWSRAKNTDTIESTLCFLLCHGVRRVLRKQLKDFGFFKIQMYFFLSFNTVCLWIDTFIPASSAPQLVGLLSWFEWSLCSPTPPTPAPTIITCSTCSTWRHRMKQTYMSVYMYIYLEKRFWSRES